MRYQVLLVDDDPAVRESLSRVLQSENYSVVLASNGAEALELLALKPVDLVLLDLNIPVISGWDALEQIRSNKIPLPVIVITAQPYQQGAAIVAGANALMEKPLELPALLTTMSSLIAEAHKAVVC